jgi:hypothetical protein
MSVDLELDQNDFVGTLKNVPGCKMHEINPAYLQAVSHEHSARAQCTNSHLKKTVYRKDNEPTSA